MLVGEVKVAVVGEEDLEDVGVALAHGPQHRGGPCVVLRGHRCGEVGVGDHSDHDHTGGGPG